MQDQEKNYFDETYELVKEYSDERLLLLKIQTAKKTGKLISKLILMFVSATLFFFLLLFVSIMLGYLFAEKTGSMFYGFGIVAGIYFLLFVLFLLLFRTVISKKVMDMITAIFFENNNQFDPLDDEE
jgi:hypothetical protein